MAVAGLRGTGDWGTDERPKSFREYILWRDPNGQSPLTALMARMRSEKTNDPEFKWWEEELNPIRLQVNGAMVTADTTCTVDSGDGQDLVAGDILLVETAENVGYTAELLFVTAVTSATVFTVVRGQSGSTAASIADDTFLTKIGNVFSEGSASPSASSRNPTQYENYCQIFKTAYELTKTAELTHARTGPALQNDKKRKSFDHSVALEFSTIFGKSDNSSTGANGKPIRTTGGILEFLAAAYAAGSTHCMKIWTEAATEDTFLDNTYKMWDYSTGGRAGADRIVLCGNGALNTLNKLAKNSSSTRINYDGVVNVYGMNLTRFIMPQGAVYLRTHPLFNVHGRYTDSMLFINPQSLVERPFRATKPQDGIQGNDEDTHKGQWLSECGIEFQHLKTMQYWGAFQ
jgi:hypothetical protein